MTIRVPAASSRTSTVIRNASIDFTPMDQRTIQTMKPAVAEKTRPMAPTLPGPRDGGLRGRERVPVRPGPHGAPVPAGRIDVHAHYVPAEYRQALIDHGHAQPDGFPALPDWSPEAHLAMMDRVGIATAMLSITSPGVSFGADPVEWARRVNEAGAATVRAHPGRFGLLASLPLPDVDAALSELAYALDVLGADGVMLLTNVAEVYLGDPRLDPLMAELHRRRVVTLLHPTSPACFQRTALGHPRPVMEFLFDTTRAVANMVVNGTLARFPDVRLIVPHAGAALPVLADRIAGFADLFGLGGQEPGAIDVLATLEGLHYEVGAGMPFPRHIEALLDLVDVGRLVYGTDFPFGGLPGIEASTAALDRRFADGDLRRITRETALGLFPRLRA
jgi:6-methylsalicylate decarboxylase